MQYSVELHSLPTISTLQSGVIIGVICINITESLIKTLDLKCRNVGPYIQLHQALHSFAMLDLSRVAGEI